MACRLSAKTLQQSNEIQGSYTEHQYHIPSDTLYVSMLTRVGSELLRVAVGGEPAVTMHGRAKRPTSRPKYEPPSEGISETRSRGFVLT